MGARVFKSLIIFAVAGFASIANAGIYIDGQLQAGNAFDIVDSTYYLNIFSADGDSVINLYGSTDPLINANASVTLSESAILNIYYADKIDSWDGLGDIYEPGLDFGIVASENSKINFFLPENDNPDFSFYLWDTEDNLPENFINVYPGLQLNKTDYSTIPYTELWRSYGQDVEQVLSPKIGNLKLEDSATINFVPEPASILLVGIGYFLFRKKN